MWSRLMLPDCEACPARKATWLDRICVMCRVEADLLEEMLNQDSASND